MPRSTKSISDVLANWKKPTSSDTPPLQSCSDCKKQYPLTDFWRMKQNSSSFTRFSNCKQCANPKRRQIKPRGFATLPIAVRKDIVNLRDQHTSLAKIHKKYSTYMSYSSLCRWERLGDITIS